MKKRNVDVYLAEEWFGKIQRAGIDDNDQYLINWSCPAMGVACVYEKSPTTGLPFVRGNDVARKLVFGKVWIEFNDGTKVETP